MIALKFRETFKKMPETFKTYVKSSLKKCELVKIFHFQSI